jgi:ketosteroid isomerase-like protein
MTKPLALLALVLAAPLPVVAQQSDAKVTAQKILDAGAALFDTKDAQAMAATYVEDAELLYTSKDDSTGRYKNEMTRGREGIQKLYEKLFEGDNKTTSRNVVESATMIRPDLLLIQGSFQPDISNDGKYPFVQVRTLRGDKWLIMNLQVFVLP